MYKTTLGIMFSLLAASAFAATTSPAPTGKDKDKDIVTLSIDDSHQQMKKDAKGPAPMYTFKAGDSVKLDAGSYTFVIPDSMKGKTPNYLQVVFKSGEQYSAAWDNSKTSQILSKDTLTARTGTSAFSGFVAAKEGVVAIGNNDGGKFNAVWVARFSVN